LNKCSEYRFNSAPCLFGVGTRRWRVLSPQQHIGLKPMCPYIIGRARQRRAPTVRFLFTLNFYKRQAQFIPVLLWYAVAMSEPWFTWLKDWRICVSPFRLDEFGRQARWAWNAHLTKIRCVQAEQKSWKSFNHV